MAMSVLLTLLAAAGATVRGSSPPTSSCYLVWPKFGDIYPVNEPVFVLFYCDLSEMHQEKLNAENGMIMMQWDLYVDQGFGQGYQQLKTGNQSMDSYTVGGKLSRDFKAEFFQNVPSGIPIMSMKFAMRVSVAGDHIDSMNAIVTPGSEDLLTKLLGEENLPLQCASENSLDQKCEQPKHFDFIEIGTSGFDTLIQAATDDLVGLSVEPLKHLQDTLPDRRNVVKISCAIGDVEGWKDIYYMPTYVLEYLNFSLSNDNSDACFLYGIGRIGETSPLVMGQVGAVGSWVALYLLHARREIVRVKTIRQIYAEQRVSGVTFLKLDCEGFDYKIMNSAIDFFLSDNIKLPTFIEFENNSGYADAGEVINRLLKLGYHVYAFFYGVKEAVHTSRIVATNGVVYAELKTTRREAADEARVAAIASMVPTDLLRGRELCSSYQRTAAANGVYRAAVGEGYFCSILMIPDKEVLSVKDSFTVL